MKHIHKYVRVKLSSNSLKIFFKCALPGCVHKVEKPFAVGRFSVCNRCGETFILDARALDLSKPHCDRCTNSAKKELINNLVEKMGL